MIGELFLWSERLAMYRRSLPSSLQTSASPRIDCIMDECRNAAEAQTKLMVRGGEERCGSRSDFDGRATVYILCYR